MSKVNRLKLHNHLVTDIHDTLVATGNFATPTGNPKGFYYPGYIEVGDAIWAAFDEIYDYDIPEFYPIDVFLNKSSIKDIKIIFSKKLFYKIFNENPDHNQWDILEKIVNEIIDTVFGKLNKKILLSLK